MLPRQPIVAKATKLCNCFAKSGATASSFPGGTMSSNAVAGESQNASGAFEGALPERNSRTVAGHCAEVIVQTPQEIDQDFPFFHLQARQQPSFALERCDDDPVMNGPSLPRQ